MPITFKPIESSPSTILSNELKPGDKFTRSLQDKRIYIRTAAPLASSDAAIDSESYVLSYMGGGLPVYRWPLVESNTCDYGSLVTGDLFTFTDCKNVYMATDEVSRETYKGRRRAVKLGASVLCGTAGLLMYPTPNDQVIKVRITSWS